MIGSSFSLAFSRTGVRIEIGRNRCHEIATGDKRGAGKSEDLAEQEC